MATTEPDEIDIQLRPPDEVGARIVVLATVYRRLFLEMPTSQSLLQEDPEAERFDLRAWLDQESLTRQATAEELRLIETPVGRLSPDGVAAALWAGEALAALAWAAGLAEIPSSPAPANLAPVLDQIPAPWGAVAPFKDAIELRGEEEIARERERAELWLWRANIEQDRREAKGKARSELTGLIREVTREAAEAGLISQPENEDFSVDGVAVTALDRDRIEEIAAIAGARLHALNWLCGFGESWDAVPLET